MANRRISSNFLARELTTTPPKSNIMERCKAFMPLIAAANEELKRNQEDKLVRNLDVVSIEPITKRTKDEISNDPILAMADAILKKAAEESDSDSTDEESDAETSTKEGNSGTIEIDIDVRELQNLEGDEEINNNDQSAVLINSSTDLPQAFRSEKTLETLETSPQKKEPKKLIEVLDMDDK